MLGMAIIGGITKATIGQIVATAGATYGLNRFVFKPVEEATKMYVNKKVDEVVDRATNRAMDNMADTFAKAMAMAMATMNNQSTQATEEPKG